MATESCSTSSVRDVVTRSTSSSDLRLPTPAVANDDRPTNRIPSVTHRGTNSKVETIFAVSVHY